MAAAPKTRSSADSLWIAEVELESSTRIQGFGATAEECLQALIDGWGEVKRKAGLRREPEPIAEFRDEISLRRCRSGRSYVQGLDDAHWAEASRDASGPEFDHLFEPAHTLSP